MPFHKLCFVFFYLVFLSVISSQANDRFYVADIRVDIKDTSAAQARLKAITQGQQKAFKMLIEQLLSPEDQNSLVPPTENQLNAMIQDFEVQNEKNSNVRYIGTLAFQFYPAKVQEFLKQKEKSVLPIGLNKKILVLPIYEKNQKTLLWQEDNPWRNAWNHAADLKSTYVLPLGDLNDILDFPERTALDKDVKRLQILRERYRSGYILLAILKHDAPFELNLFLYDAEGLSYSEENLTLLGDTTLTPALIQKALTKATEMMDKFSTEHKAEMTTEKQSFEAQVFFQNHQEWSQIQKLFAKAALVRSFDIISLQRRQATIQIYHTGAKDRVFQALEKQGFEVYDSSEKTLIKGVELRLHNLQDSSPIKNVKEKNQRHFKNDTYQDSTHEVDQNFYENLEN
ncbi:MAG: DUF2066 domain-containing protein [Janthinobacterium lividum]